MKLFKLISPPETVWANGSPTNQTYTREIWVNPNYIISIEVYKLDNSKVTVQGAMLSTYLDDRSPDELASLINDLCITV